MRTKLFLAVLVGLAGLFACNKQKVPGLDYTEKLKTGVYHTQGLPGESHIGSPAEEMKQSGYEPKSQKGKAKKAKSKPKSEESAPPVVEAPAPTPKS